GSGRSHGRPGPTGGPRRDCRPGHWDRPARHRRGSRRPRTTASPCRAPSPPPCGPPSPTPSCRTGPGDARAAPAPQARHQAARRWTRAARISPQTSRVDIESVRAGHAWSMSIDATAASGVQVCSLKRATPQSIPANSPYTVVRVPFGSAESSDRFTMHQVNQPDGYVVTSWDTDDRSGLIWPSTAGWGTLYAMIQWEAGSYDELRDQFVRDPLGLTPSPNDTTATEHRPPSPGMQCWTKQWGIFVDPAVPLALRATHDAGVARDIVLAEFKLVIHEAA